MAIDDGGDSFSTLPIAGFILLGAWKASQNRSDAGDDDSPNGGGGNGGNGGNGGGGGTAPPQNRSPTARIDATGRAGEITLDGRGSSDPDGDRLSYSWSVEGTCGGGLPVNKSADGAQATVQVPCAATYDVSLTVTDPSGKADTASTRTTTRAPADYNLTPDTHTEWDTIGNDSFASRFAVTGQAFRADPATNTVEHTFQVENKAVRGGGFFTAFPIRLSVGNVSAVRVVDPLLGTSTVSVTATVPPGNYRASFETGLGTPLAIPDVRVDTGAGRVHADGSASGAEIESYEWELSGSCGSLAWGSETATGDQATFDVGCNEFDGSLSLTVRDVDLNSHTASVPVSWSGSGTGGGAGGGQ